MYENKQHLYGNYKSLLSQLSFTLVKLAMALNARGNVQNVRISYGKTSRTLVFFNTLLVEEIVG